MTGAQEGELRRALQLGSLHDINAAIGLLRDLEAAEPVSLPFAVMRYVLQEIDHRFEGEAITLGIWRRVKISPRPSVPSSMPTRPVIAAPPTRR